MCSAVRRRLPVTLDRLPTRQQSTAFLLLYALASAGGAVAYVPFLTILLPVRVAAMAGAERVEWLAYITFFGAAAASIGGILFGWLSDRSGTRRPWISGGLIGSLALMACVPLARHPLQLLLLIVAWQLALNMMLGPLSAWAADHVPPAQLGVLGGLLTLSPALGAASGALVTLHGVAGPTGGLLLVEALVAACVLPAIVFAKPLPAPLAVEPGADNGRLQIAPAAKAMWLARFLVQICEATLFAYLYYYLQTIDSSRDASWIARLFGIVACTAVPAALLIGRWSDKRRKPATPLIAAALTLGVALLLLATASTGLEATAAYVLFGLATTIFLSLHSAQTLRVLHRVEHRGRDLGLFNLTNTAPSLIMPWLTVAIVPRFGFSHLFVLLSALPIAAAIILVAAGRRIARGI